MSVSIARPKGIRLGDIITPEHYKSRAAYKRLFRVIEDCRDARIPWRRGEPINVFDVLNISETMLVEKGIGKVSLERLNTALKPLGFSLIKRSQDLPKIS